jgi:hypothetical protein
MPNGDKYQIEDLTAKTEAWAADIMDAVQSADYLHTKLGHSVRVTNMDTMAEFKWGLQ